MIIIHFNFEKGNHGSEFSLGYPWEKEGHVMGHKPHPNDEDDSDPDDMLRCEVDFID